MLQLYACETFGLLCSCELRLLEGGKVVWI